MADSPLDDMTKAAANAIEEAVRKCTVGIVSGSGVQLWQEIGTGTLIRWHGKYLILTAEHVIGETSPKDLRYFLPNDVPSLMVERNVLLGISSAHPAAIKPFSQLGHNRIYRDGCLDLAAIHIGEAIVVKYPSLTFFELTDESVDPTEGQTSMVLGFPYDISRVLKNKGRVVFMQVDWSKVELNRPNLGNFDPSLHFLASYTQPEEYPGANPSGLSGAARWCRKGNTPGVWHPNIEILGITVAYYERSQLLKMVRRDAAMRFLLSIETV